MDKYLLIPSGTKVIGVYNSSPPPGTIRLAIMCNRLIFPKGVTYDIGFMQFNITYCKLEKIDLDNVDSTLKEHLPETFKKNHIQKQQNKNSGIIETIEERNKKTML